MQWDKCPLNLPCNHLFGHRRIILSFSLVLPHLTLVSQLVVKVQVSYFVPLEILLCTIRSRLGQDPGYCLGRTINSMFKQIN